MKRKPKSYEEKLWPRALKGLKGSKFQGNCTDGEVVQFWKDWGWKVKLYFEETKAIEKEIREEFKSLKKEYIELNIITPESTQLKCMSCGELVSRTALKQHLDESHPLPDIPKPLTEIERLKDVYRESERIRRARNFMKRFILSTAMGNKR